MPSEPVSPAEHPFDTFKAFMRKLVAVPKEELNAELQKHNAKVKKRRSAKLPTERRK